MQFSVFLVAAETVTPGENQEAAKKGSPENLLLRLQPWCGARTAKGNVTLIYGLSVRLGNQILSAPEINLLSEVTAQLAEMGWNHALL